MYKVTLKREFTQNRSQDKAIEFIKRRVLSSKPAWQITDTQIIEPEQHGFKFVYRVVFTFQKTSGQRQSEQKEFDAICEALTRIGSNAKFRPCVWVVDTITKVSEDETSVEHVAEGNTKSAMAAHTGITLEEVREKCLPEIIKLLTEKDAIAESIYFREIFERDAQIRIVLSSIRSFLETNGERRNHVLLHGLPACAKTQILNAVTALLSDAAVVRLDGTSTTPAGIYKTYFEDFNDIPEPPFTIIEEIEKTAEESLRVWLGVMDERGELRKVNAREQRQRNLKVLCLGTANDMDIFNSLMGGSDNKPGALSSRFAHQIECPRPNDKVLRLILERDIRSKGGKMIWVDAVMELAKATMTNDPRKVLSFLDGGERLENGEYQKDIMAVMSRKRVISNDE